MPARKSTRKVHKAKKRAPKAWPVKKVVANLERPKAKKRAPKARPVKKVVANLERPTPWHLFKWTYPEDVQ